MGPALPPPPPPRAACGLCYPRCVCWSGGRHAPCRRSAHTRARRTAAHRGAGLAPQMDAGRVAGRGSSPAACPRWKWVAPPRMPVHLRWAGTPPATRRVASRVASTCCSAHAVPMECMGAHAVHMHMHMHTSCVCTRRAHAHAHAVRMHMPCVCTGTRRAYAHAVCAWRCTCSTRVCSACTRQPCSVTNRAGWRQSSSRISSSGRTPDSSASACSEGCATAATVRMPGPVRACA